VTAAWNAAGRAAPQSEAPQEAQAEACEILRGLDLDVRTLARELDGREGADLEVALARSRPGSLLYCSWPHATARSLPGNTS
jgi:hypothetical protein